MTRLVVRRANALVGLWIVSESMNAGIALLQATCDRKRLISSTDNFFSSALS
jgi:hypothetical protein